MIKTSRRGRARHGGRFSGVVFGLAAIACSGNPDAYREQVTLESGGGGSGKGGASQTRTGTHSGGTSNSGGTSKGGTSVNAAAGGLTSVGGSALGTSSNVTGGQASTLQGGSSNGGSSNAPGSATGGRSTQASVPSGGIQATSGGSLASGGSPSGGVSGLGGTTATSAAATGAVGTSAAGEAATGGLATGGATAASGAPATGGISTGGVDTGGASSAPSNTGGACANSCSAGDKRCDPGGLQSCESNASGCLVWGPAVPCQGPQSCTGEAPNAACTCPPSPPACTSGAGSYCSDTTTLQSCVTTAGACVVLGNPTLCAAALPCSGNYPAASCSCPAAPTICTNTTGTFCDTSGAIVTCQRDTNGCLYATSDACPTGKPCGGPSGAAACTCPSVPACAGRASGSYCSGANVISCTPDANGCLVASTATCPAGKPCAGESPNADCTCPVAPGLCMSAGTFKPGTVCDGSGHQRTCGLDTNACPALTQDVTCASPQTCQGSLPTAGCACPQEPQCASYPSGKRCGDTTTLITCSAINTCQQASSNTCTVVANEKCVGAFPESKCELAAGYATDLGSRNNLSAAFLYGVRIQVTTPMTLSRLGLFAGSSNTHARLAIYADSSGNPGAWLASATGTSLTVQPGRNEYLVNDPSPAVRTVALTAGYYWIFGVFEALTQLGSGSSASVRYQDWTGVTWTNPFPTTLTGLTAESQPLVNFYVIGVP